MIQTQPEHTSSLEAGIMMNGRDPLRTARTLVIAGSVAVVALMAVGGSANAQYPPVGPPPKPPISVQSVTVDLTPTCVGPDEYVEYVIKPAGVITGDTTLVVRDEGGNVVHTSKTLSGSFAYPGGTITATAPVNPPVVRSFVYPADKTCSASSPPGVQGAQASLPTTGSSGVSTTLLVAGLALLTGVGIAAGTRLSQRRQATRHPA